MTSNRDTADAVLVRSMLFTPAANRRAMEKSRRLACDGVIFDLEDSVAPDDKTAAREELRSFLTANRETFRNQRKCVVIRINPLSGDWGAEDLLAARACRADAVLLAKVERAEQVIEAASALDETDAPDTMRIWAMIETSRGILNAAEISSAAHAACRRLSALVVGPNDIGLETGVTTDGGRTFLVPWLMQIVLAARSGGLSVLDGVYNDFRDGDGFAAECRQARAMGFDGKTLIHPAQIDAANAAFGVDQTTIAEARRIVEAFARPENDGRGVVQVDGRMVERLHLRSAEALLNKAEMIEERATSRSATPPR